MHQKNTSQLRRQNEYKKIRVSFLISVLLFTIALPAHAQERTPTSQANYSEIAQKYNLKLITVVPKGITPVRVNSPAELESYVQKLQANSKSQHFYYRWTPLDAAFTLASGTQSSVVTRSCTRSFTPATFNVWADILVKSSGSFRWIDSVLNTRTGLTGATATATLSNDYSYSYNQTTTSVSVKGGGIVSAYISTPIGTIYLWSEATDCSFTYSVY